MFLGQRDASFALFPNDGSARLKNPFDSTLREYHLAAIFQVFENNRHLFDARIEGEFSFLVPLRVRTFSPPVPVPVEAGCEDLDGDFCRFATGMPFTMLRLVNVSKVGHGRDIEVLDKIVVVSEKVLGRGDFSRFVVDCCFHRRQRLEAHGPSVRVERFIRGSNRVCPARRNPCLLRHHFTLG
ncbi:hypothetical protein ACKS0A_01890 [Histoplasma ohiense]